MSQRAGESLPSAGSSAKSETDAQSPGAMLQQERARRGLSVQQAAEELHLDTWIIEAIESNRFLALGAPVYAKGYLRKYATMLGLAPEVIVGRYDGLSDNPVEPTPVPVITTTPPPRPKWPKRVAWSALAIAIAAIGFAAFKLFAPAGSAEAPAIAIESSGQSAMRSVPVVTSMPSTTTRETVAPVVVPASERVPIVSAPLPREPLAEPAVDATAGESVQLSLEFTGSSWVEVYDAAGQRLLFEVGQPGRVRAVSGPAPLNVVVGLASAVSAKVNDRSIVVPRRANRDAARFSVGADGSVR